MLLTPAFSDWQKSRSKQSPTIPARGYRENREIPQFSSIPVKGDFPPRLHIPQAEILFSLQIKTILPQFTSGKIFCHTHLPGKRDQTRMQSTSKRVFWVDAAKAIGILLVIYGHIVELFVNTNTEGAFLSYKFIYSFHMPLFFFIAGFFFKARYASRAKEIQYIFYKRILPVFLFGIMALPVWIIYRILIWGYVDIPIYEELILPYLKGHPLLNQITWFLVCLFTTEVIAVFIIPKATTMYRKFVVITLSLGLGLLITANMKEYEIILGIGKNTWYFHEALVALGFYTLGYSLFGFLKKIAEINGFLRFLVMAGFLGVTILTFDLNKPYDEFVVIMKESWHGESIYFLVSAFSGIAFMILLSTFIPKNKVIEFVGQNTLILIGTTGLFHNFFNIHIVTKLGFVDSIWGITLFSALIMVINLLLSLPIIFLLNKYLPQLVGKPHQEGPFIPKLI
jgi:fucose 4-O-acetylase-like acetyltransferase